MARAADNTCVPQHHRRIPPRRGATIVAARSDIVSPPLLAKGRPLGRPQTASRVAAMGQGGKALRCAVVALLLLAGCATRPVNPALTAIDPNAGYMLQTRQKYFKNRDNLVVLAFSGGGTRAAAFSYGVLEFLHRNELVAPDGRRFVSSTVSMSSPACRAAASRRWLTACMATSCSATTSSASSSATSRASSSRARSIRSTGATCRRRGGAVPSSRPSCTMKSCSTARPSATSTAAMDRSSSRRPPTSRPAPV